MNNTLRRCLWREGKEIFSREFTLSIKILATIGPASLDEDTVVKMAENGVGLFRINLSHTALDDVKGVIAKIQSWTNVPVCLDSEGAQIRNQAMINESVLFNEGDNVKIIMAR